PGGGVGDELPMPRTDTGVGVEAAEPDEVDARATPVLRPEVGAALGAEDLRVPVLRIPRAQQLVALEDPERVGRRADRGGGGRSRATLTARAVAVARGAERLLDLVANRAAHAPAGEHALSLTALEDDGVGLVDDCPPLAPPQLDLRRRSPPPHP